MQEGSSVLRIGWTPEEQVVKASILDPLTRRLEALYRGSWSG